MHIGTLGTHDVLSYTSISMTIILSSVNVMCGCLHRAGLHAVFSLNLVCDMTARPFSIFKIAFTSAANFQSQSSRDAVICLVASHKIKYFLIIREDHASP